MYFPAVKGVNDWLRIGSWYRGQDIIFLGVSQGLKIADWQPVRASLKLHIFSNMTATSRRRIAIKLNSQEALLRSLSPEGARLASYRTALLLLALLRSLSPEGARLASYRRAAYENPLLGKRSVFTRITFRKAQPARRAGGERPVGK